MHGKELTHRIGVVSRAPYTETYITRLGTKNELADELAFQVHYAPKEFTPPPWYWTRGLVLTGSRQS